MFSSEKSSRAETAREDSTEATTDEKDETEVNNTERKAETEMEKTTPNKGEKKKKGHHAISVGTVASIPNFAHIKSKVNSRSRNYKPSEGR